MSDTRLAYLCAFAPGEGVLVYAGTGSAASHVAAEGGVTLVGGKGVIIDDAGGGYWIATRGLRSLLRREDARPGSAWKTPLGQAFARRSAGADWPSVRQVVYGGDRGGIGRLALAVAEAAAGGDASALSILEAGARVGGLRKGHGDPPRASPARRPRGRCGPAASRDLRPASPKRCRASRAGSPASMPLLERRFSPPGQRPARGQTRTGAD